MVSRGPNVAGEPFEGGLPVKGAPADDCDSAVDDGDGCDSNCTNTGCGNGIVTVGEECDDGNTLDDDGCTLTQN